MKMPLQDGEQMVRSTRANLQRGAETVGGHLHLTSRRLIFEAHRFNIQRGATEIPLQSIRSLRPAVTKFLNVIPLLPNSIEVDAGVQGAFRLVVPKRKAWIDAIDTARSAAGR